LQVRQDKNIAEQDLRAVKRLLRTMLGIKSMEMTQHTLAGIKGMAPAFSLKIIKSDLYWPLTLRYMQINKPWVQSSRAVDCTGDALTMEAARTLLGIMKQNSRDRGPNYNGCQ
jgi:hypothetical protein